MSDLRILWANTYKDFSGQAYGYSLHAQTMRKELEKLGVEIVDTPDDKIDFAVSIVIPHHFKPIPGVKNILFSMTEFENLPHDYRVEKENLPDLFVVPSQHSKRVFEKEYKKKQIRVPVELCPEGVYQDQYPYYERKEPLKNEPFKFLWLGSFGGHSLVGDRKGFSIVNEVFTNLFASGNMPDNWLLYIKTSGVAIGDKDLNDIAYFYGNNKTKIFERYHPESDSEIRTPGLILDPRNVSTSELNEIYKSAHCFLFPSRGEGYGLTLAESLSTGLPSIYTNYSAMKDYAIGYPLNFKYSPYEFKDGEKTVCAEPDKQVLKNLMFKVYNNYSEALDRGKRASERMHTQYSWKQAAERFIEICIKHKGERNENR